MIAMVQPDIYKKNLGAFYSRWRNFKEDEWGNSDILVVCTPVNQKDDRVNQISSEFLLWLIGKPVPPGTAAVFAQNEIHFLCAQKNLSFFNNLAGPTMEAVRAQVFVHKTGNSIADTMIDDIILQLRPKCSAGPGSDQRKEPFIVGCVQGEVLNTLMFLCCGYRMTPGEIEAVYVNDGYKRLLSRPGYSMNSTEAKTTENSDFPSQWIQMQSLPERAAELLMSSLPPEKEKSSDEPSRSNSEGSTSKGAAFDGEDGEDWVLVEDDDNQKLPKIEAGSRNCFGDANCFLLR